MANVRSKDRSRFIVILQGVVLSVTALYFGRPVLMPLALAVLLTFLLRPVVTSLERRRIPRPAGVGIVIVLIVGIVIVVGWQVGTQLSGLAGKLPQYRDHIREKIADLKSSAGSGNVITNIEDTVKYIGRSMDDAKGKGAENPGKGKIAAGPPVVEKAAEDLLAEPAATEKPPLLDSQGSEIKTTPQAVRIVDDSNSPLDVIKLVLGSVGEAAATGSVVIVLVVFMLLDFEELRNRIVRIAGTGRITVTTKTLDEVGKRIGRYLLMNALVNSGFGVTIWLGLHLIGVDYAPLWGFLAATLRFVPYVGPIVASALPVAMSIIQHPDWLHVFMVIGLFVVVELLTNMIIEPMTYGKSAGVSTVALLITATFWTWVWGPMGLILSVPMTVVATVLGKYIPQLEALGVLLGDTPALASYVSFYQRLLAGDLDEAAAIWEEAAQTEPKIMLYETFTIPALLLAERDHADGELTTAEKETVWQITRDLIEDTPGKEELVKAESVGELVGPSEERVPPEMYIVGVPAFDAADELSLLMLARLIAPKYEFNVLPATLLASEVLSSFAERKPDAVWISALGLGGLPQTRYLCKKIHQYDPNIRIFVGRWGFRGDRDRMAAGLKTRGANQVVTSLIDAEDLMQRLQPLQHSVNPQNATGASGKPAPSAA